MNENPLVSVIMGIYNCAGTLEEAVQCIIGQTFTDWELIMCDDGSSDDTYDTALRLAERDERIRVLKNEKNLTLAPTLNVCLKQAKGKFIARMDGDDICDPTRLQKEVDILQSEPDTAIVSCNMDLYDTEGVFRTIRYKEYPQPVDFAKGNQFCHAGCMVRADAIRAVNGYSEKDEHKRIEDYELWTRMYAAGYRGHNILETLYSMRDDRNAIRRRSVKNRWNEFRLRFHICRIFHLPLKVYGYAFRELLKILVPGFIYKRLHRNKH